MYIVPFHLVNVGESETGSHYVFLLASSPILSMLYTPKCPRSSRENQSLRTTAPCASVDLELLLHLVVHTGDAPDLLSGKNIVPGDGSVPAAQDVLVDAGQTRAEG
jgi:hypothetical protein